MNNQNQDQQWQLLVLILKQTAESKGITQNQIAGSTGMQQSAISRFFLLKYKPTLETFLKIANALNCKINITDNE